MKAVLKEGQEVLFPRQTNYHHGGIMTLTDAFGRSCPNFPAKLYT